MLLPWHLLSSDECLNLKLFNLKWHFTSHDEQIRKKGLIYWVHTIVFISIHHSSLTVPVDEFNDGQQVQNVTTEDHVRAMEVLDPGKPMQCFWPGLLVNNMGQGQNCHTSNFLSSNRLSECVYKQYYIFYENK